MALSDAISSAISQIVNEVINDWKFCRKANCYSSLIYCLFPMYEYVLAADSLEERDAREVASLAELAVAKEFYACADDSDIDINDLMIHLAKENIRIFRGVLEFSKILNDPSAFFHLLKETELIQIRKNVNYVLSKVSAL